MKYRSDFPISFLKQYHLSGQVNYASDTFDIIYVLSGSLRIGFPSGDIITYPENNLTVLHSNASHVFYPDDDNIFIHLGMRTDFLQRYSIYDHQIVCDTVLEPNRNYIQIKNLITTISSEYLDFSDLHELSLLGHLFELLNLLKTDYVVSVDEPLSTGNRYEERVQQIREYLDDNYRQPITLNSLAQSMFLTPQYLSKFFKKNFNANFNQYLNQIRIEHALRDIRYTNTSITEIAIKHGFPNISTFNRHFKEFYQCSPREYRKNIKDEPPQTTEWLPDNQEYTTPVNVENINSREITTFVGFKTAFPVNFTKLINIGNASQLLMPDFKEKLLLAKQDLKLSYVRIEGLISNAMIPRLSAGNDYYFSHITEILDFLWENQLIPFIELGKNSFDYITYTTNGRGYSNNKRFLEMLEAFLEYATTRFDPNWRSLWIFELWKNPKESADNYFDGFVKINELIKHYIPQAKFGGPGHITALTSDVLLEDLKEFKRRNIEPDFFSAHFFLLQYSSAEDTQIDLSATARSFRHQQQWIFAQTEELFGKRIPLYITEFNSSLIPQTYINESCYQAAFLCKTLLELHEDSEFIGYWLLDEVALRERSREILLTTGISLINNMGIKMPSYHAYRFLCSLGSFVLEQGENYCITQSEESHYQILTYNYAHFTKLDSYLQKNIHSIRDVYSCFEAVPPITMQFSLHGLKPGTYRIKRYLLDRTHGSLIDIHLGGFEASMIPEEQFMYKMQTPGRRDLNYLQSTCIPEERTIFVESNTELSIAVSLSAHNVCLFDIVKEI